MRHKDFSGEPYFLIEGEDDAFGKWYKLYPWNADIMKAHWESMQYVKKLIEKKEKDKCYAV